MKARQIKQVERTARLNWLESILSMLDNDKISSSEVQEEIQKLSQAYPENSDYKQLAETAKLLNDPQQAKVVGHFLFDKFAELTELLREVTVHKSKNMALRAELEELSEMFDAGDEEQGKINDYLQALQQGTSHLKNRQESFFKEIETFLQEKRRELAAGYVDDDISEIEIKEVEVKKELSAEDKLAAKINSGEISPADLQSLQKLRDKNHSDVMQAAIKWCVDREKGKSLSLFTQLDLSGNDVEYISQRGFRPMDKDKFNKSISEPLQKLTEVKSYEHTNEEDILEAKMGRLFDGGEPQITLPDLQFLKKIWEGKITKDEVLLLSETNLVKILENPSKFNPGNREPVSTTVFSKNIKEYWESQSRVLVVENAQPKSSTAQMSQMLAAGERKQSAGVTPAQLSEVSTIMELARKLVPSAPALGPVNTRSRANAVAQDAVQAALKVTFGKTSSS